MNVAYQALCLLLVDRCLSPTDISKRLDVDISEAQEALEVLYSNGYVAYAGRFRKGDILHPYYSITRKGKERAL